MVDKWLDPEWIAQHKACRERRLQMIGVPHHQGNRSLNGYAQTWVRESIFYYNVVCCMISNHLAVFLAVIVAWWAAGYPVHGICHGPQGQGKIRRLLQPG